MNLKGYNDSPVENLGSCSVYFNHGKQPYKVSFEVTDSKGHMILGRQQALLMRYVSFPEIQQQAAKAKVDTSIKTITDKPVKPPCRTSYSSRTRMYRQEDNHRREDTSVTYNQRVLDEGIL